MASELTSEYVVDLGTLMWLRGRVETIEAIQTILETHSEELGTIDDLKTFLSTILVTEKENRAKAYAKIGIEEADAERESPTEASPEGSTG
jgi:hypothetical protein